MLQKLQINSYTYRGADKSLARPGRKQARKLHVCTVHQWRVKHFII